MVPSKFGSQLGQQHYIMAKWANWVYEYTGGDFRGVMRKDKEGISIWVCNIFYPEEYIQFFELKYHPKYYDVYPVRLTLCVSSDKKFEIIFTPEGLEENMEKFLKDPVINQSFDRLSLMYESRRRSNRRTEKTNYELAMSRDNPNNY